MRFFLLYLLSAFSICAATFTGTVVGVTDGDTITVLDSDNVSHKIRLYGIDAPENLQTYGYRSKQLLSALVNGDEVHINYCTKDSYGRVIGKVYINSLYVNAEMIRLGMAWHYKQYSKDKDLAELEDSARREKRGIWSQYMPTPPWEYRIKQDGTYWKTVNCDGICAFLTPRSFCSTRLTHYFLTTKDGRKYLESTGIPKSAFQYLDKIEIPKQRNSYIPISDIIKEKDSIPIEENYICVYVREFAFESNYDTSIFNDIDEDSLDEIKKGIRAQLEKECGDLMKITSLNDNDIGITKIGTRLAIKFKYTRTSLSSPYPSEVVALSFFNKKRRAIITITRNTAPKNQWKEVAEKIEESLDIEPFFIE